MEKPCPNSVSFVRRPRHPSARPVLAEDPPRFVLLEREVEIEYRPQMLAALQSKVDAVADAARGVAPACPHCAQPTRRQDTRPVTWLARCRCLHAPCRGIVAHLAG